MTSFGMQMPNRNYAASFSYRYGFNGKENDNEVKGVGNEQDYGMRIYDPRVGRFLSADPLTNDYTSLTPYQFASNDPIESLDRDGEERADFRLTSNDDGSTQLNVIKVGPKIETIKFSEQGYLFTIIPDESLPIPAHIRIEYNGKHYIFADNGPKAAIGQLPVASNYAVSPAVINYMNSYKDFIKNPSALAGTLVAEEGLSTPQDVRNGIIESANIELVGGVFEAAGYAAAGAAFSSGNSKPVVQTKPNPATVKPKTKTAQWVEDGKVSPELVKKYNKLNQVQRPFLPFRKSDKDVVKDINKEVNGTMQCVNCRTNVVPAKKSQRGVTPAPNEAHVDHATRRREGGSGTPDNGDVYCERCNVKEKH